MQTEEEQLSGTTGFAVGKTGKERISTDSERPRLFYGVLGPFLGAFSPWRAMLYPALEPSHKRCCINFLRGMEDPATFKTVDSLVTGFYHLGSDCEELEAGGWVQRQSYIRGERFFGLSWGFPLLSRVS